MKKMILFLLCLCVFTGMIGCRRRRSKEPEIETMPKKEVRILDKKDEELIIKETKVTNDRAKPIVEVDRKIIETED